MSAPSRQRRGDPAPNEPRGAPRTGQDPGPGPDPSPRPGRRPGCHPAAGTVPDFFCSRVSRLQGAPPSQSPPSLTHDTPFVVSVFQLFPLTPDPRWQNSNPRPLALALQQALGQELARLRQGGAPLPGGTAPRLLQALAALLNSPHGGALVMAMQHSHVVSCPLVRLLYRYQVSSAALGQADFSVASAAQSAGLVAGKSRRACLLGRPTRDSSFRATAPPQKRSLQAAPRNLVGPPLAWRPRLQLLPSLVSAAAHKTPRSPRCSSKCSCRCCSGWTTLRRKAAPSAPSSRPSRCSARPGTGSGTVSAPSSPGVGPAPGTPPSAVGPLSGSGRTAHSWVLAEGGPDPLLRRPNLAVGFQAGLRRREAGPAPGAQAGQRAMLPVCPLPGQSAWVSCTWRRSSPTAATPT